MNKKIPRLSFLKFFTLLLFVGYGFYLGVVFLSVPIDSDFASLLLEGFDVQRGNIFLSGWSLTQASFLFTEIPFFALSAFLLGIRPLAVTAALWMSFFACFIAAWFLLPKPIRSSVSGLLLFFCIAGFPNFYQLEIQRGHMAVYLVYFVLLFLIARLPAGKPNGVWNRLSLFLIFILMMLSAASDPFILVLLTVPSFFVLLFAYFRNQTHQLQFFFPGLLLTGGSAAGIVLSRLIQYFGGGRIASNSGITQFPPLAELPGGVLRFIEYLTRVFRANLEGVKIISLQTFFSGLRILIFIFGLYLIGRTIARVLRNQKVDWVSLMLSLGTVFLCGFLVVGGFFLYPLTGRYIAWLPMAWAIIILREFQIVGFLDKNLPLTRVSYSMLFFFIAVVLIAHSFLPLSLSRSATAEDLLARCLLDHNLDEGYAGFWVANHTVVSSHNRVHPRAIYFYTDKRSGISYPFEYHWFARKVWFPELDARYVVI